MKPLIEAMNIEAARSPPVRGAWIETFIIRI